MLLLPLFIVALVSVVRGQVGDACERNNECTLQRPQLCLRATDILCIGGRCRYDGSTDVKVACRNATGPCDSVELCNDGLCPADAKQPALSPCMCANAVTGMCDGVSDACVCPNVTTTTTTTTTTTVSTTIKINTVATSAGLATTGASVEPTVSSGQSSATTVTAAAEPGASPMRPPSAIPSPSPAASSTDVDLVYLAIPAVIIVLLALALGAFFVLKARKLAKGTGSASGDPAFESARESVGEYGSLSISPEPQPIVGAYANATPLKPVYATGQYAPMPPKTTLSSSAYHRPGA